MRMVTTKNEYSPSRRSIAVYLGAFFILITCVYILSSQLARQTSLPGLVGDRRAGPIAYNQRLQNMSHNRPYDIHSSVQVLDHPPDLPDLDSPTFPGLTKKHVAYLAGVMEQLGKCKDFRCMNKAQDRLEGYTRFNAPHFFLLSFKNSGGRELLRYLGHHPQFLLSANQGPDWFGGTCGGGDHLECFGANANESGYLTETLRLPDVARASLQVATCDASISYIEQGRDLAEQLYQLFPWIKIVLLLREPVSRVIPYAHETEECDAMPLKCMLQMVNDASLAAAVRPWIQVIPTNQIFAMQYEALADQSDQILYDLKAFLGLDTDHPKIEFEGFASQKQLDPLRLRDKRQYHRIIKDVKKDTEQLTELLSSYGLIDKDLWTAQWNAVWESNYAQCDNRLPCLVHAN